MELEAPGLLRYWFEFDLSEHRPPEAPAGTIRLDGGSSAYRLLWAGAGVTGYDEQDCLMLLERTLGESLPPLLSVVREPVVGDDLAKGVGNPAWRGVWFPGLNMAGPTLD